MEKEALKLYYKFYNILEHKLSEKYSPFENEIMKECALITVNEILKVAFYADDKIYNHYLELKEQIEKL